MTRLPSPEFPARSALPGFELLSRVAGPSPEPTLLLGARGNVLFANAAVTAVTGHAPGALVGRAAGEFTHGQDWPGLVSAFRGVQPGQTQPLPAFRVRRADGPWRWVTGRLTHLLDDPGVGALLLALTPVPGPWDDGEAVLGQLAELLAGTQGVEEMVSAMLTTGLQRLGAVAGVVRLLDAQGDGLQLVRRSGVLGGQEGGSPGEDAGGDQVWRTGEATFRCGWAAVPLLLGGVPRGRLELTFGADQAFGPQDRAFLQRTATLYAASLERGLLHDELQRQQAWLSAIGRNSSDIVTVLDGQAVIRYESGSIQRILGYSSDELLGQHVFELIHPGDHGGVSQALAKLVAGASTISATLRFRHRDGHWVWLESLGSVFAHPQYGPSVLVNSRDVTVRQEAQAAREEFVGALELSGRNFRRLADHATDMVCQYTLEGDVEYVSPSASDLLGYSAEELLGPYPLRFVYEEDLDMFRGGFEQLCDPEAQTQRLEYRLRRKDGSPVWVETTFRSILDPASGQVTAWISASRDIEARKQAELQLKAQLERYHHLLEFNVSLEQLRHPLDLTREALNRCLALTEYDSAYAFDCRGDEILLSLLGGEAPSLSLAQIEANRTLPFAHRVQRALERSEAYFSVPGEAGPGLWASFCVLPITQQGTLTGILTFGADRPVQPSAQTQQLLRSVAARLGHALERHEHLQLLGTSREETLRALGLALEYRDYETKGHTDRVVALSERLGQTLGLAAPELDALRWGAFLHDTGKVAIPDEILLKPGRLTPEEWAVIRRHPTIGFEMLHHIPSLPPATLDIVLYHQERWNGSGYPAGLAGEAIPLVARVFAVVDVYDALTSERPYKPAWSHEAAAEQLRREAGSLLDRDVVEAFLSLFRAEGVLSGEGETGETALPGTNGARGVV